MILRLCVIDHPDADGVFSVQITAGAQTVTARTEVALSDHDRRDLHWYLEEYLEETYPPGPERAARIETRMRELGEQLFRDLFEATPQAVRLWAVLAPNLPDLRIEISAPVVEASAIPWELLRDPISNRCLALTADTFVRTQSNVGTPPLIPSLTDGDKLRVLLAICRPDGAADVAFRSVAARLLKSVSAAGRDRIELTLLRPPTFPALTAELAQAKKAGKPYHLVHFDGHGDYGDAGGVLAFEDGGDENNRRYVDGAQIGQALRDNGVGVLVLNACRSAYAEGDKGKAAATAGHGDMVAAYGSLAQQVVDAGVAGVVAMRYNLWVVTAAQFVEQLYAALANGETLGAAVSVARKHLADAPARRIADNPVDLQDWQVPTVFEAAPLRLLPPRPAQAALLFDDSGGDWATWLGTDGRLPRPPDTGFIGRDETLLALDRAFDGKRVALLHAFAGSGKTATAAEFARWLAATNGLGPQPIVFFDSFESYDYAVTLPGLLDKLAETFAPVLQQNNIHWHALNPAQRRALVLNLLAQAPVLWIWDNVEPVAGFPAGADSPWTAEQQAELRDFLRDVWAAPGKDKGRILLTSRRDERGWLGEIFPRRVTPPPLRRADRLALAEKLAEARGRNDRPTMQALAPLLDYSAGNPMALTVLVGQALRDRLRTVEQVETYIDALRRGEGRFDDDRDQGRARSLGASLAYGFDAAFTDTERKHLALLALFHGVAHAQVLVLMGHPENPGLLPDYAGLGDEYWLGLLRRAAEIGLLTGIGGGFFTIHPALPWFLHDLFQRHWPGGGADDAAPVLSWAVAVADFGNEFATAIAHGQRQALGPLRLLEGNLRRALTATQQSGMANIAIGALQGLREIYQADGRWEAWRRLVEDARPLVADAALRPLPGREAKWSSWIEYAGELAEMDRDGDRRLRLLRLRVDVNRQRTAAFVTAPQSDNERLAVRSLAAGLQQLGTALADADDADAAPALREAKELFIRIGDRNAEAITAFNLGHAYLKITALRNLDAAADWYRAALELFDTDADRAGCHGQLGLVALERFDAALEAQADAATLTDLLRRTETAYQTALNLTPADAHADLAVFNNMLGVAYRRAGMIDAAASRYAAAVKHSLANDDRFGAGQTRFNMALLFLQHKRFADARLYAVAALDDYRSYQGRAADREARAENLLAKIDEAAAAGGAG
jgi:tetratricopeptide (TPR) repeat protein